MITRNQAGITIGFALTTLFSSQVSGDMRRSAAPRSFADAAPELVSQQGAASDRSGERLSSDGTMQGVTLRRTRVYDAQGSFILAMVIIISSQ
jgi:hypothetical protein